MDRGVHRHFTRTVGDYDTVADNVVMKNRELHEALARAVRSDAKRVVDLGCGTGHGVRLILERCPEARVIGIDFSPRMIAKSRQNLLGLLHRVDLVEGDFTEVDLPSECDAVVSAIAIHNVSHEAKNALFQRVHRALNPGGIFVNADFIEGETPDQDQAYKRIYERYIRERLQGEELEAWLHHAFKEDRPMKLSEQSRLLQVHGFAPPEVLWQFENEALYVAKYGAQERT